MFPIKEEQISKSVIHQELRRSIIVGHIKPGERFEVAAIAQQYNARVAPVRDGLQTLSQEALADFKPRTEYFVTTISLKLLRD